MTDWASSIPYPDENWPMSEAIMKGRAAAHASRSAQPYDIDARWADEEAGEAAIRAYLAALPLPAAGEGLEPELKIAGYGRDDGRLVRVEVLDGSGRIDLFRPAAAASTPAARSAVLEEAAQLADKFELDAPIHPEPGNVEKEVGWRLASSKIAKALRALKEKT